MIKKIKNQHLLQDLNILGEFLRVARTKKSVLDFAVNTFLHLGFDRVRIWLMDLDQHIYAGAKSSHISDRKFQAAIVDLRKQDAKNLPIDYLKVIGKKKPFINKTFPMLKKFFNESGMKYSVEFPLYASRHPLGLVSVDNSLTNRPIDLKKAEMLIMPFVNYIAMALYRVMSEKRLRGINAELKNKIALATAELKRKKDAMAYLATHDVLSGLPNRRDFDQHLKIEFKKASRANPITLAIMDIDFFKQINDRQGHLAGDKAIAQVGKILSDDPSLHYTARYAGDEFIILLRKKHDCLDCPLANIIKVIKKKTKLTVSIGAATYPGRRIKSARDLTRLSDQALYQAKNAGRDRLVWSA